MNQSKFRIRGLRKHPECVQKFGSVQGALGREREKCRWPELSRKNSLQILYFVVFAVQVNQSHHLDYFRPIFESYETLEPHLYFKMFEFW